MKKIYLFLLSVGLAQAQVNTHPQPFYSCDNDGDRAAEFNLPSWKDWIVSLEFTDQYSVTYFETAENAQLDLSPLPDLYANTTPDLQIIFARVTTVSNGAFVTFPVTLQAVQKPVAHQAPDLTAYYEPGSFMGARFNIYSQQLAIRGDQTDIFRYQINYYLSQTDAENMQNEINNCFFSAVDVQIFARISIVGYGCYDISSFMCHAIQGTAPTVPGIVFADPNLKASLLATQPGDYRALNFCFGTIGGSVSIDENGDGEIQPEEAEAIYYLRIEDANITSLAGLEAFKYLQVLNCNYNQLTTIDLSVFPMLTDFTCSNNNLTQLDLSQNHWLYTLSCADNNLNHINIKNGRSATFQSWNIENWSGNPNLVSVCVDEIEAEFVQQTLLANNYQNVSVNSYCSAAPGGNYNTITGKILFDADANGCDANDLAQPYIKVNINDAAVAGSTFTMNDGQYAFTTAAGIFTLTPQIENSNFFSFSPANATVSFPSTNETATHDFCFTAIGNHPDAEITMVPFTNARPGFNATYKLVYKNKGNQLLSGNVTLTFNDAVLDVVSASPATDNQTTNTLTWNYVNLRPFESKDITVVLNLNSPMQTPPLNSGDLLGFTAVIDPVSGDETSGDNTFAFTQNVVNSLDPNDKTCLEGNIVAPSKIGDYLHYSINFENTGTAAAERIVVKDVIDTTKFEMASLQLVYTSHAASVKITGNRVEFVFENIDLDAGEHGNVTFKIKTKSNLVAGNSVSNQADIYFDYNFPIETNTATSVFSVLGREDFKPDNSIAIMPNPATDFVTVKANSKIQSMTLFDVQGRNLSTKLTEAMQATLDIAHYPKGIYFLKVTTDKGSRVEKLIRK